MRSFVLSLVLALGALGIVAVTPSESQAQWGRWRRPYYSSYYYPGYSYSYYTPGYSYYSSDYPAYSYYPTYGYYSTPGYYSSYTSPSYSTYYYSPAPATFYRPRYYYGVFP